jgi:hypothetical protein
MGKDRSGKYHPAKGTPSGAGKDDTTDRYEGTSDDIPENIPVRHPNRNTDKRHESFNNQQDAQDSRHDPHAAVEAASSVNAEELPHIPTRELLASLANHKAATCISIYMTTHEAGVEVNEQADRIKFKSHLREIAAELKGKDMEQHAIELLLAPAYKMVQDDELWVRLSKGLAVFIADNYCSFMRLPMEVTDKVLVNSTFFLSPLMPMMTTGEYFYLLVISKKQVKLFKGDVYGLEHIPVEGLPKATDELEKKGENNASYTDDRLPNFLEAADDVIWKEVLHNENVPLLLAGVESVIPVYRSVCDYKHVYSEALTGSHERDDAHTLHALAMEIMAPYFEQRREKALELYGNQFATSLTSSMIDKIVPAAYYGRVSHLFVQKDAPQVWGTFDEMKNELNVHTSKEAGGDDLLNNAIVKTLLTGGEVFMLDKEQMPGQGNVIAAVLRY